MKKRFDVVVAGAGLAGLAAAAQLSRLECGRRLRLLLIDGGPRPRFDPAADVALRVSALSTGSARLLSSLGAWDFVRDTRACAYDRMRVWDATGRPDGPSALRFDAADFGVRELGFIVENVLVRSALAKVLDDSDVELRFETPIRDLQQSGRRLAVVLDGDERIEPDLLIAADGAQSFVREHAGIATRETPYGQTALVTHLESREPHRNTAWQRFLRDGPLGMLPLADGRISVVWSTSRSNARRAMAASDEELGRILSEASDRVLGELVVAGPRGDFPLCARHAERYVAPGLALVGDAAHAVHPLAGQGANLGLRDASRLAEVVDAALRDGQHPGDLPVLRRYARARRGENALMMHFLTGLNRLFATDSALVGQIRAVGMRAFNHSGPIRAQAVAIALGMGR
jgi:2-polyprenylphenol 6-hydroxylase